MLSVPKVRELLGDTTMSDDQAEKIRDAWRSMAELVFETLRIDRERARTEAPPKVNRSRLDPRKQRVVS